MVPLRLVGPIRFWLAASERLCQWLLENVPEYRARLEPRGHGKDWWGREGRPDAGIELVAQERDGGLWAIQAKQYNPAYAIRKADTDSFLSESSRREFTYRFLIATTDPPGLDGSSYAQLLGEARRNDPALGSGGDRGG
jgi:predicted helicase